MQGREGAHSLRFCDHPTPHLMRSCGVLQAYAAAATLSGHLLYLSSKGTRYSRGMLHLGMQRKVMH